MPWTVRFNTRSGDLDAALAEAEENATLQVQGDMTEVERGQVREVFAFLGDFAADTQARLMEEGIDRQVALAGVVSGHIAGGRLESHTSHLRIDVMTSTYAVPRVETVPEPTVEETPPVVKKAASKKASKKDQAMIFDADPADEA